MFVCVCLKAPRRLFGLVIVPAAAAVPAVTALSAMAVSPAAGKQHGEKCNCDDDPEPVLVDPRHVSAPLPGYAPFAARTVFP
jgi:hypothetical protein